VLSKAELKQILAALGRKPNKNLGQVFISSRGVVERIAEEAVFWQKNCAVFELGGGLGNLTEALARNAEWVFSVEIDEKFAQNTQKRLAALKNVTIVCADGIERGRIKPSLIQTFLNGMMERGIRTAVFCSNMPYCISGAVLMSLPILPPPFVRATIMTQREVYERITASYGSKNYGLLSLILQRYFKVVKVLDVSRENFYPKPEVDSTIIGLKRNEVTADVSEYERELKIIEKIFSMRRKTLRQVLLKKFNLEDSQLSDIMKAVSGENLRAEQLPPDVIWMLVGVLKKLCV